MRARSLGSGLHLRVRWRTSVALTGTVLKWLAVAMGVPLIVAVVYGEDVVVFLASMATIAGIGILLEQLDDAEDFGPREALLFVALTWAAVAVVGSIPYLLSTWGTDSTLAHPVNALFESTSGVTTTGATVMGEISTERHSHALMMWRQLSQWLGGMGIIVLMVAILPEVAVNGAQVMKSEAPGPELQKLTPRIAQTARALWLVYFVFTVLLIAILYGLSLAGLAENMDFYNAVAHGFSTLPTGGFSPQSGSIAAFSAVVQWAVIPFMVVAGTNFALFYALLDGDPRRILRDTEFRAYAGMLAILMALVALVITTGAATRATVGGVEAALGEPALRQAAFQIGSLLNSTGFATSDFAAWDTEGQMVLLFAMFVGGSAGSTGGGIKVIRWLVVLKLAKRELVTTAHPEAVQPIRLGGYVVDEDAVRGVLGFTVLYLVLFAVSAVVIALDAGRIGLEVTALEALSASLAAIGNIGPGFGQFGPFGDYIALPDSSKLLMIFLMWLGRLEIIPVLVLFTGAFWRR